MIMSSNQWKSNFKTIILSNIIGSFIIALIYAPVTHGVNIFILFMAIQLLSANVSFVSIIAIHNYIKFPNISFFISSTIIGSILYLTVISFFGICEMSLYGFYYYFWIKKMFVIPVLPVMLSVSIVR